MHETTVSEVNNFSLQLEQRFVTDMEISETIIKEKLRSEIQGQINDKFFQLQKLFFHLLNDIKYLTLLQSERPKLYGVLAILSAIGLNQS